MIDVSVVYAKAQQQWIKEIQIERGSSVEDAIIASGLLDEVAELEVGSINELQVGVYSKKVKLDELVSAGDRIEIYRALKADPKEVRRQLALLGKTMGNRSK